MKLRINIYLTSMRASGEDYLPHMHLTKLAGKRIKLVE